MIKQITCIVKTYSRKDNVSMTFQKATILGKFLPLVDAEDDVYYNVRFVGGNAPTKDGIYHVGYEDKGLWIDKRPEFAPKHIVRVRAVKVVFDRPLENNSEVK